MRRPAPLRSEIPAVAPVVVLLLGLVSGRLGLRCHALLPPSPPGRGWPGVSASARLAASRASCGIVRSSLDDLLDEAWEEEASEAILGGQGDLLDLGFPRGGDAAKGGRKFSPRLSARLSACISAIAPGNLLASVREGYRRRVAADESFLAKSLLEVVLAASTQYVAELGRRGRSRMLPEIDFVIAGILTAICGKYYSMWRVARTVDASVDDGSSGSSASVGGGGGEPAAAESWRDKVPTNAFQPTLLDGRTAPSLGSRTLAFLAPMPQLFRAGVLASTVGYGLAALLVRARSALMPGYVAATEAVSVPLAAVYTGFFVAVVSNVRYQLLQGVVEPYLIDGTFAEIESLGEREGPMGRICRLKAWKHARATAIVAARWGNGVLGSWMAIGGMKALGLQRLKE